MNPTKTVFTSMRILIATWAWFLALSIVIATTGGMS